MEKSYNWTETVPTFQGPANDVYYFCWKIGVKWRDLIGQIPLQFRLYITVNFEMGKPM